MQTEDFVRLVEYDNLKPIYFIDRLGNLYSWKENRGMVKHSLYLNKVNGYQYVMLVQQDGTHKTYRYHRLVAITFLDNPENKPTINHKNGIKTDNRVCNLEWATISENTKHAFDTGLIKENTGVVKYFNAYDETGSMVHYRLTIKELNSIGITKSNVYYSLKTGKFYGGLRFEYCND